MRLVAHRDWLETVRSKLFWVGVLLPLLIILCAAVILLITAIGHVESIPDSLSDVSPHQQQVQNGYVADIELELRDAVKEAHILPEYEAFIANVSNIVSGRFRLVLFFCIVLLSGFLAKNTLEENFSKIADMLFASVSSSQLMDGNGILLEERPHGLKEVVNFASSPS